jgi:hypothetical protein
MDFFGEPEPAPESELSESAAASPPSGGTRARRTRRAKPDADAAIAAEPAAAPGGLTQDAAEDRETLRPSPPPTPASFAAQATNPDLADFVAALDDEQLGYLAVAAAKTLRQRLGGGGGRRRRGAGSDALARAARLIASELAVSGAGGGDPE